MKKLLALLVVIALLGIVEYVWLKGTTVVERHAGRLLFRVRAIPTTIAPGITDGHFYLAEVLSQNGNLISSYRYSWDSYESKTFKTNVRQESGLIIFDVLLDDDKEIHVKPIRNGCLWWSSGGGYEYKPQR